VALGRNGLGTLEEQLHYVGEPTSMRQRNYEKLRVPRFASGEAPRLGSHSPDIFQKEGVLSPPRSTGVWKSIANDLGRNSVILGECMARPPTIWGFSTTGRTATCLTQDPRCWNCANASVQKEVGAFRVNFNHLRCEGVDLGTSTRQPPMVAGAHPTSFVPTRSKFPSGLVSMMRNSANAVMRGRARAHHHRSPLGLRCDRYRSLYDTVD